MKCPNIVLIGRLFFLMLLCLATRQVYGQCTVEAFASSVDIICGENVKLSAVGNQEAVDIGQFVTGAGTIKGENAKSDMYTVLVHVAPKSNPANVLQYNGIVTLLR